MRAIRYLLLAAVGGLFVEWGWRYINRPLQKHVKTRLAGTYWGGDVL